MEIPQTVLLGRGDSLQRLQLAYANRHGLVTGATGTGKTITLQIMAEAFSRAGVPVFCADVKGDLSGIAMPGTPNPKLAARAAELGDDAYAYAAAPTVFWDLFGEQGHPVRTTISEMGPVLLARLLELNEVQEGVLTIAFRVADDEGLLLLDLKDLRAMLAFLADHAEAVQKAYGNVSKASVGAIQRRLLMLEEAGADHFFGEPALDLLDLLKTDARGHGHVNVLMADRLMRAPRLYATFLLWLLAELFEQLPEVGDPEKPRLVFFFDEAHLLFDTAPKALLEKVEQVVRLIRSKGVGVYFVTQNPIDVPPTVLGQLGNRVQHALRAFTPRDQKAVRVAAETFRPNPAFKTEDVITELGVGEALVSTLLEGGVPSMVERTRILPPRSRMGPLEPAERQDLVDRSPLFGRYEDMVDRESAFERLEERAAETARQAAAAQLEAALARHQTLEDNLTSSRRIGSRGRATTPASGGGILGSILTGSGGRRQGAAEAMATSMARTMGTQLGRSLVRGVLGGLLKSR